MHSDPRPAYPYGAIIPLSVARWFFLNPVDHITFVPEEERQQNGRALKTLLRFHSGEKHLDHYANCGIYLNMGIDKQGRESLVDLQHHETVAEIVAWERRQQAVTL